MADPVNTVPPVVSGTVALGEVLTTTDGTWTGSPSGFTVQWLRDGVAIDGETAHTHRLVRDDLGAAIVAEVTASPADPADASATALSNSLAPLPGTLVVEDGTGKVDSESYATIAFADDYHSKRGNDDWAAQILNKKEAALRKATDFMTERYRTRWLGFRVTMTQALDWPRYDVPIYDTPGGARGFPAVYAMNIVPGQVQRACCEFALRVAQGLDLSPDLAAAVKSKKVGPIEVVYERGTQGALTFRSIEDLLSTLIQSNSFFRVSRG